MNRTTTKSNLLATRSRELVKIAIASSLGQRGYWPRPTNYHCRGEGAFWTLPIAPFCRKVGSFVATKFYVPVRSLEYRRGNFDFFLCPPAARQ